MVILINYQQAVLKQGTSFDFISENNLFTGADSYTLSISFPLKGCPQNIAIFGHLYRKDCDFTDTVLDCEIHDRNFHKYGAVSIVEISDIEVKVQFLEGRSKRNYHSSFDTIYINEIQMPSAWITPGPYDTPNQYMRTYAQQKQDEQNGGTYYGMIILPWVNNTSGNIQNPMVASQGDGIPTIRFKNEEETMAGFPFLIEIIKLVLNEVGYTYDLSAIENSQWADIIVCNALPVPWELQYLNFALPHWTVTEFLEQLELFLGGQFIVDEKAEQIIFSFNSDILAAQQTIEITKVIDTHTVELSEDDDVENTYLEQRNIAYQDCDHQMWKFYSCPWALKQLPIVRWANFDNMMNNLSFYLKHKTEYTHEHYRVIHYSPDVDTYFVLNCYKIAAERDDNGQWEQWQYLRVQPVNEFAPYIYDKREDADVTELSIVPVCIDHTDDTHGDMVFIECGTYGDDTEEDVNQTQAANTLAAGEKDQKEEYLDKMYVGFWNGAWLNWYPQMPHPIIDPVEIRGSGWHTYDYSLRLHGLFANQVRTAIHNIDQSRKYNFQFLADSIPDVRSIFLIHGKKYLAEKITATFSAETGMSSLLKMSCFRMND